MHLYIFSVSNQLFDCTLFKYFVSMLAHINWHWQVIKCLVTQSNLLKVIKLKIPVVGAEGSFSRICKKHKNIRAVLAMIIHLIWAKYRADYYNIIIKRFSKLLSTSPNNKFTMTWRTRLVFNDFNINFNSVSTGAAILHSWHPLTSGFTKTPNMR